MYCEPKQHGRARVRAHSQPVNQSPQPRHTPANTEHQHHPTVPPQPIPLLPRSAQSWEQAGITYWRASNPPPSTPKKPKRQSGKHVRASHAKRGSAVARKLVYSAVQQTKKTAAAQPLHFCSFSNNQVHNTADHTHQVANHSANTAKAASGPLHQTQWRAAAQASSQGNMCPQAPPPIFHAHHTPCPSYPTDEHMQQTQHMHDAAAQPLCPLTHQSHPITVSKGPPPTMGGGNVFKVPLNPISFFGSPCSRHDLSGKTIKENYATASPAREDLYASPQSKKDAASDTRSTYTTPTKHRGHTRQSEKDAALLCWFAQSSAVATVPRPKGMDTPCRKKPSSYGPRTLF